MIVDSQCHWFSPTLLDALLDLDDYPRCRRDGDGYAFEVAPGRFVPWGPAVHGPRVPARDVRGRRSGRGHLQLGVVR